MKKEQSPFLEKVRNAIRVRHYSIRTEQAYLDWTKRFILFHRKRHPQEMGAAENALVRRQGDRRDCAFALQHANAESESGVALRLPPHSRKPKALA